MQNCETSYLPKIHRSVQRRHGLSIEEVYADHLSGYGEPVILTDAITACPALSKWTFQFFRERYGEDLIFARGGVDGIETGHETPAVSRSRRGAFSATRRVLGRQGDGTASVLSSFVAFAFGGLPL